MISRQFCSLVFRLDFSFSYPAIREGFSKLSFISPLTAPALAGLFFTGWLELLRAGTFYPARNIIGFEGQFSGKPGKVQSAAPSQRNKSWAATRMNPITGPVSAIVSCLSCGHSPAPVDDRWGQVGQNYFMLPSYGSSRARPVARRRKRRRR